MVGGDRVAQAMFNGDGMRKRWIWAVAAIFLLLAGAYLVSPFWAARQLRIAAVTGDTDGLEKLVDFPAVRGSLKAQLAVIVTKRLDADPSLKGNPFAGIGMLLMPTVINNMVDRLVTPEAISTMATRGEVVREGRPTASKPQVTYAYGYRALDRFDVQIRNRNAPNGRIFTFVFARRGLFAWHLVRIQIPPDVLTPAA